MNNKGIPDPYSKSIILPCPPKKDHHVYHADLPYPTIQVASQNKHYAQILSQDYASEVSELSAITQYIDHQINCSTTHCDIAMSLLGIAKVEMRHLQMIGQLILLLGGELSYASFDGHRWRNWTPEFIDYGTSLAERLENDHLQEQRTIAQYHKHIHQIDDPYIQNILQRIIADEELHITLLNKLIAYHHL